MREIQPITEACKLNSLRPFGGYQPAMILANFGGRCLGMLLVVNRERDPRTHPSWL